MKMIKPQCQEEADFRRYLEKNKKVTYQGQEYLPTEVAKSEIQIGHQVTIEVSGECGK